MKHLVLSLVAPGKIYPVTEPPFLAGIENPCGYHGKKLKEGYQSHYTLGIVFFFLFPILSFFVIEISLNILLVDKKDLGTPIELENFLEKEKVDELVIQNEKRALPFCIIYSTELNRDPKRVFSFFLFFFFFFFQKL